MPEGYFCKAISKGCLPKKSMCEFIINFLWKIYNLKTEIGAASFLDNEKSMFFDNYLTSGL